MPDVCCILCGHAGDFTPRFVKEGYPIERCPECGLTQLHPMPSSEQLAALYEGDYFAKRAAGAGYDDYAEQEAEYAATFREEIGRLRDYVSSGRILDVGCGYGYFMEAAKAAGYEVYGIDVSSGAVEKAARRMPGGVYHGDIRDCPALEGESFDAVFVSHLIEHIREPKEFVDALNRLLKEDGVAVFLTPNECSALARVSRSRWVSLKVPEHVAFYNPRTLARLLEHANLEVVSVESACQYYRVGFVGKKVRALLHPMSTLFPGFERTGRLSRRMVRIPNGSMRVIARKVEESADSL